jgi:hypothetical protein
MTRNMPELEDEMEKVWALVGSLSGMSLLPLDWRMACGAWLICRATRDQPRTRAAAQKPL